MQIMHMIPGGDSQSKPDNSIGFRWSYIIWPLAVLCISIILTVIFYPRLPDSTAMHFQLNGAPDGWASRTAILLWFLAPQAGLVIIGVIVGWGTAGLIKANMEGLPFPIDQHRIISLMANLMAIPQSILAFAMLDIFSYNAYGVHLFPVWIFALIILLVGAVILGRFFLWAVRSARKNS